MASLGFNVTDDRKTLRKLIPDYVSSVTDHRGRRLAVFVIEVKAPGRNKSSDDFCKTAEELKRMVDAFANYGMTDTTVCGLLVDGNA